MGLLTFGGLSVGAQAMANLGVRHANHAHTPAVKIAANITPTPVVTPAPTPAPKPAATKAPVRKVVTRVAKVLPAVAPAPNSAVDHLVAVAPTAPAATSTPTPGSGSGTPPPSTGTAYSSTNWSGYMSPAGNFTGISGSWGVPHVAGNGVSTSGDAAWIGIGGVTSQDLIQVGTDDTVTRGGQVSTIAFYEMLPDSETLIPGMNVSPGDVMTADIHLVTGSQWLITISDVTQSETFSIAVTYASSKSTAEWIQEDPSYSSGGLVPFDRFGSVNFTNSLAVSNGVAQNLLSSGAQKIILVNSRGRAIATPSEISSDGGSFSVTAN